MLRGVAMLAAVAGLLACHGEAPLEKVVLRLNWTLEGDHAGFFLAREKGFYAEEGLDVEIVQGTGSATTVNLVGSGSAHFGYADAGTMIKGVVSGQPVRAVAVLLQISPMAVIYRPENPIPDARALRGKRLGVTSGDALGQIFPAVLTANGIDENEVSVISFPTPAAKHDAMLAGRVDAFLGYAFAQPVRLRYTRGVELESLLFSEAGVNTLSNAIIVNSRFLEQRPELVRRFLRATQRGVRATRENSQEAAKVLSVAASGLGLSEQACLMQIRMALRLLNTRRSQGKPIGWSAPSDWTDTLNVLSEYAGFRGETDPEHYYSNAYLGDVR